MNIISSLQYDELCRISQDTRTGLPALTTCYGYDVRSRMTSVHNPTLSSTLKYNYNCNISEISYTYDGNHIINAYNSMNGNSYYGAMHFKNGADEEIEYFYDSNGNTIKDLNRGISDIAYDNNNLPKEVTFNDGSTISSIYDADGNKLSVTRRTLLSPVNMPMLEVMESNSDGKLTYNVLAAQDTAYATTALEGTVTDAGNTAGNGIRLNATANSNTEETVTDYCGSFIYQNGILDKVLFEGGYITYNGSTPTFHFYIQDHLGNNRAVVNHSGTLEQETHYYPFGAINGALSTNPEIQPYKFTGKELDRTNGYDMMDYGARMYAADLGRWMVMDPLAEKYYDISPYAYCHNNPVGRIDPDGMDDFFDSRGNFLYTNGTGARMYIRQGSRYVDMKYFNLRNSSNRQVVANIIGYYANAIGVKYNMNGGTGYVGINTLHKTDGEGRVLAGTTNGNIYIKMTNGKLDEYMYDSNQLKGTLRHENEHKKMQDKEKGKANELQHAQIVLTEIQGPEFENCSQEYKNAQIGQFELYLNNVEETKENGETINKLYKILHELKK